MMVRPLFAPILDKVALFQRQSCLQDSALPMSMSNEDGRRVMRWIEIETHCVQLQCTC